MRIAVDLDEVMCPMLQSLSRHYSRTYKTRSPARLPSEYNYAKYYGISDLESKYLVRSFYESPECTSLCPLEGSVEGIQKLKRRYSLGIVTGRQIYGKSATVDFVNRYFHDMFDFIVCTNSFSLYGCEIPKSKVCAMMNCDVLIDDSAYNCDMVSESGCHGILFGEYPWNAASDAERLTHWDKIDDYL